MNVNQFFQELKRRNVYRVGIAYGAVAWLIIQVVVSIFPYLHIPDWCIPLAIWTVLTGFPIALVLAWIYEMSPEGIIRTSSSEAMENPLTTSKKKPFTSNLIIGVLLLAVVAQQLYIHYWNSQPASTDKSIAVLPFKNESPNQENQYFCNGMMEAILNHLSKIEELRVISRNSVEQSRN